jgi:hypothetical protein
MATTLARASEIDDLVQRVERLEKRTALLDA